MSGLFKAGAEASGPGDDPTRALSVLAVGQNRMYENALKVRIALQKSLDIGNRLPANKAAVELACSRDSSVREAYRDLSNDVSEILSRMHSVLECQVMESSSKKRKIPSSSSSPSSSKGKGVTWEDILQTQSLLRPKWEETINKLDKRMKYGSLVQEKQKGGLRLFNQTIFDQVEGVMSDGARVREKSRMARKDSERIDLAFDDDDNDGDDGTDGDDKGGKYDMHVYDDKQFYTTLLRSFITSSSAESGVNTLGAADLDALRRLRQSSKKGGLVDRKASKGRRIRYVVHAKLQNFMFPVSHAYGGEEDDGGKLFQSLFQ